MEKITLALGCFWCSEAIFQRLNGVDSVTSGYANSKVKNPSEEEVYSGKTEAAEAVQITFDPKIISLDKILEIFWHLHDPTTLNRQGADFGTEYRSSIFYDNDEQKSAAEESRTKLEKEGFYKDPIVTTIEPLENFYPAEDYHKSFYDLNKDKPYCRLVIDPKINKLIKEFSREVKGEYKT